MDDTPANRTFAKALRAERKRLDLTQTELAEKIGTSQQNIAGMEKGLSLPKPELHARMVEVFGDDSVIAALPPRRDLDIAHSAIARASASSKIETPPERSVFSILGRDWREGFDPKASDKLLAQYLGPELSGYVGAWVLRFDNASVPGVGYKAHYLSPKLCVEIRRSGPRGILMAARLGMHQLTLYKNLLRKTMPEMMEDPPPSFMLALLMPEIDGMVSGKEMSRASYEALACGIDLRFCNNLEAVSHGIKLIEQGNHSEEAYDEEADY